MAWYTGLDWWEIGEEEWRPIPGYPNYEASELGQIRNASTRALLKPFVHAKTRRLLVGPARAGGGYRNVGVHQLVALAFLGPAPGPGYEVDHKDQDYRNNRASNLEWVTGPENRARYHAAGHPPRPSQASWNQRA